VLPFNNAPLIKKNQPEVMFSPVVVKEKKVTSLFIKVKKNYQPNNNTIYRIIIYNLQNMN
jgi:hypothetical protein